MNKSLSKNLILLWFCIFAALITLSSCYSVRIVSRDGIPDPDYLNNSPDFYKNKKVHIADTTIKLKAIQGDFSLIKKCGDGGFYAVEYRVTLGDVLLNAITLGRVKKVHAKYVCLKAN